MSPQILAAVRWKICKGDLKKKKIVLLLKYLKKPAKLKLINLSLIH